jgi:hypothetical protein
MNSFYSWSEVDYSVSKYSKADFIVGISKEFKEVIPGGENCFRHIECPIKCTTRVHQIDNFFPNRLKR